MSASTPWNGDRSKPQHSTLAHHQLFHISACLAFRQLAVNNCWQRGLLQVSQFYRAKGLACPLISLLGITSGRSSGGARPATRGSRRERRASNKRLEGVDGRSCGGLSRKTATGVAHCCEAFVHGIAGAKNEHVTSLDVLCAPLHKALSTARHRAVPAEANASDKDIFVLLFGSQRQFRGWRRCAPASDVSCFAA